MCPGGRGRTKHEGLRELELLWKTMCSSGLFLEPAIWIIRLASIWSEQQKISRVGVCNDYLLPSWKSRAAITSTVLHVREGHVLFGEDITHCVYCSARSRISHSSRGNKNVGLVTFKEQ